eukprot:gene30121-302_t
MRIGEHWALATSSGAGAASITAAETAAYLRGSALASSTLRKIWRLSDTRPPRGQLTKDEFTTALQLIAAGQEGLPIELKSIEQVTLLNLVPHFGPGASASVATLTGLLKIKREDIPAYKALWGSVTSSFEDVLSAEDAKAFFK